MAAPDYINITLTDDAAKYAAEVKTATRLAKELFATVDLLVDRGHRIIGSGGELTFTNFQTLHGLPANSGQNVFDILNGVLLAFSDGDTRLADLKDRLG